jgi:hypothetical protein
MVGLGESASGEVRAVFRYIGYTTGIPIQYDLPLAADPTLSPGLWGVVADFDADGCVDIATAGSGSDGVRLTVFLRAASADFDGDGAITPADIARFVAAWSDPTDPEHYRTDWNGDGAYTPADVALFIQDWYAALTNGNCAFP